MTAPGHYRITRDEPPGNELVWVYTPASSSYKNKDSWSWRTASFYAATMELHPEGWYTAWWNEERSQGEIAGYFDNVDDAKATAEALYRLHGGKDYLP